MKDLQQADAVEIMEEDIPEWQKRESLKRLAEMKDNPGSIMEEDKFFTAPENDNEKL